MIKLSLKRIMRLRGIDNHYGLMRKLGFIPLTARNFLSGDAVYQIKFDQLEKLCLALNCTPNDLLEWQPGNNSAVAETHSMNSLKRDAGSDLPAMLGKLPIEKVEQLMTMMRELDEK